MNHPRISVVVPAIAGAGTDDTLRSLEEQQYPALEALVEESPGFGDALNRGFARATGEIRAFLPAGDRLLPGTLQRVAGEVAPSSGRNVVIGGCFFVIDGMDDVLVEQPAAYHGIEEHLRIWERGFDTTAYASLFWHRAVQRAIGSFAAEANAAAVAYELGCRIGTRYPIHTVDDAFSISDFAARAGLLTEAESLAELVRISRQYWGRWPSPRRWRLAASYRRHVAQGHDRARHHARRAEAALSAGSRAAFWLEWLATWRYAPRMARERLSRRRYFSAGRW